jgi:Tfp pilus assembly protein FimV
MFGIKPYFTNYRLKTIVLFLTCLLPTASVADSYDNSAAATQTGSKRIEVYSLSQNYWDTRYGDTLGEIVTHLLPNNPSKHEALKQDIVQLNPQAFINGNPEQLLAGKRLWLPGYMKQADSKADPATTTVERYSWGNIKRQR